MAKDIIDAPSLHRPPIRVGKELTLKRNASRGIDWLRGCAIVQLFRVVMFSRASFNHGGLRMSRCLRPLAVQVRSARRIIRRITTRLTDLNKSNWNSAWEMRRRGFGPSGDTRARAQSYQLCQEIMKLTVYELNQDSKGVRHALTDLGL